MRYRPVRSALVAAVLAALVLAFSGCEETMNNNGGGGDNGGDDKKPAAKQYAGAVNATLGTRTNATLVVKSDGAFTVVSATTTDTATAARTLTTATGATAATGAFVVLNGTSTDDGSTATLTIETAERNGTALTGTELATYTNCPITAAIGTNFAKAALEAIARCLSAAGDAPASADQVTVTPTPSTPAILGKWSGFFPGNGPSYKGSYLTIESTSMVASHFGEYTDDDDQPYELVWNLTFATTTSHNTIHFHEVVSSEHCRPEPLPDGPVKCVDSQDYAKAFNDVYPNGGTINYTMISATKVNFTYPYFDGNSYYSVEFMERVSN